MTRLVRLFVQASFRAFLLAGLSVLTVHAQTDVKPKIRAITGFVRLDRSSYVQQVNEALVVLRRAKNEFEEQGYEVESLRVVTQPLGELVSGQSDSEALAFLRSFSDLSVKEGFTPNVGPAMVHDTDDPRYMRLLGVVLSTIPKINANAIIAADDGIHWKTIRQCAELVHYLSEHSLNGRGSLSFTATAMLKPNGPFYPGAYHLGPGRQFSIGLESANVVRDVFARTHGDFSGSIAELTKQLTVHAKVAESIGFREAAASGWSFMGVDPTPAPLRDVSIATALETYTGSKMGSSGTMTAALVVTTAVKAVAVKQIGYSGLMMPVMEDNVLAKRWAEGAINTDMLLAYSSVCGTGLDTIPYPGTMTVDQLIRIYGDMASLAWKWNKPLSARLMPIMGKQAGDRTEMGGQMITDTTLRSLP